MNENTDNTNPSPDDITQPTPPEQAQETPPPIPLQEETPAGPTQETVPPPEFSESAPPIPPQQPPQTVEGEPGKDEKMWGMFCHLAALAMFTSIPFANVIGPLVIWLIKKDEMPFVEDQGKESLNFQISVSIYVLCCLPLMCLAGIGAFLAAAIGIADLVFIIIAAIKANNGEVYRYPCCLRFVK